MAAVWRPPSAMASEGGAALIDGSAIATSIRADIAAHVAALKEKHGQARRSRAALACSAR